MNIRVQINEKYMLLHENVMKDIDKNASLKRLTKRELIGSKKPWITNSILSTIKKKKFFFLIVASILFKKVITVTQSTIEIDVIVAKNTCVLKRQ